MSKTAQKKQTRTDLGLFPEAPIDLPTRPMSCSGVYLISPALAALWLEHNHGNRDLRPAGLRDLVSDMASGDYMLTHQGLGFSKDGVLLDGQHRLLAIVESGVSVPMWVVVGLDPATQRVMDSGRARSVADNMQQGGVQRPKTVSSILAIEWRVMGGGDCRSTMSTPIAMRALKANPDVELASARVTMKNKDLVGWLPPAILGWVYMRAARVDADKAERFLEQVASGIDCRASDAAHLFRKRFLRTDVPAVGATRWVKLWLLCRAWAAAMSGERMKKLQVPRDGFSMYALPGPGMSRAEGHRFDLGVSPDDGVPRSQLGTPLDSLMTSQEIAVSTGVSQDSVTRRVRDNKIKWRKKTGRGRSVNALRVRDVLDLWPEARV